MDLDGDGRLTKDELKEGHSKYFDRPIDDSQLEDIFTKIDVDCSGSIEYSEFLMATVSDENILSNQNLQAAFNMLDLD